MTAGPPAISQTARLFAEVDRICGARQSGNAYGCCDRAGFTFSGSRLGSGQHPVAVGTIITDRPPHRSVRARLRIRLLRRMSGVEACIGIGVQNAGRRNPPIQDWGKTFPSHCCALATADQNTLPEPAHAELKDAQLSRVSGNGVVLVITQHNLPEPCTDLGHAIMHSALKLNLDGFKLRNHSLLRSDPPCGEGSALVALPTVVGGAQKG